MVIDKDILLCDLYKSVCQQFGLPVNGLYVFDNITGNKMTIPNQALSTLRQFIANNSTHFRPIYPISAKVVYKIWYDDGCCHSSNVECGVHSL
jgi:hypothetical protein